MSWMIRREEERAALNTISRGSDHKACGRTKFEREKYKKLERLKESCLQVEKDLVFHN